MNNTKVLNALRLLGLNPDYTKDKLKKAYRKLAKQHHPDVATEASSVERFREITLAYELLEEKLETNKGIVSNIQRPNKPKPINITLSVGLEDILEKEDIKFKVKRREVCKSCENQSMGRLDCIYCHNQSYIVNNLTGNVVLCNYCRGAGFIPKTDCKACAGTTTSIIERTLALKTSNLVGKASGSKIPIFMQGDSDRAFELPGDILITLSINKIDLLKYPHIQAISKESLTLNLDLDYVKSILGGNYSFYLFNKKIEINIPALIINKLEPRLKLDLKLPNGNKYLLNLLFKIKAPSNISTHEKQLLKDILDVR